MTSHRVPILKKDQSYTFGSYFKMKFPVAEILQELGVTFEVAPIEFSQASKDLISVAEALKTRLENRRQLLSISGSNSAIRFYMERLQQEIFGSLAALHVVSNELRKTQCCIGCRPIYLN
ncbi:MAG: hypothetical protein AAGI69_07215 [Cyanobacteria bacterium P01_H01_bin.21]